MQLLECCDETLRKDLTRTTGGSLTEKTENEVLQAIRVLAVREENSMVARVSLHNMRQDRDETIRSFGARLRGQAGVCKFVIKCPHCEGEVNYSKAILRDVLSRGLGDPEIQLDLLGDKNQDMTLEEVFQFIESKEAGKRSASRLLDSQGAEAASAYRRGRNADRNPTHAESKKSELCSYCGMKGHGKNAPPRARKKECAAYGHTCGHCDKQNHFESVCRSKDKKNSGSDRPTKQSHEGEGAVFDTLCAITSSGQHRGKRVISLGHHL